MRPLGFHHFALKVVDLERACAFYRDTLGLCEMTRHFRPDGSLRSVWLSVGDEGFLALEKADSSEGRSSKSSNDFVFAFHIRREDRVQAVEELARAGVQLEGQTRWTIFFRDPEGNRLALSHHPSDLVT